METTCVIIYSYSDSTCAKAWHAHFHNPDVWNERNSCQKDFSTFITSTSSELQSPSSKQACTDTTRTSLNAETQDTCVELRNSWILLAPLYCKSWGEPWLVWVNFSQEIAGGVHCYVSWWHLKHVTYMSMPFCTWQVYNYTCRWSYPATHHIAPMGHMLCTYCMAACCMNDMGGIFRWWARKLMRFMIFPSVFYFLSPSKLY